MCCSGQLCRAMPEKGACRNPVIGQSVGLANHRPWLRCPHQVQHDTSKFSGFYLKFKCQWRTEKVGGRREHGKKRGPATLGTRMGNKSDKILVIMLNSQW
ncbi:hypothetical protein Y032_0024g921 [Ancylostoma ceylanicum]|uniref:Uncharacterized protein n=1 Tax=Ancylostoma ceylanicum TaxID=53326 RepID=A0A016UWJ9_9BILA|nr:hypothetical protein Y032_0024g921 [Ancylostoma ceylanicum]